VTDVSATIARSWPARPALRRGQTARRAVHGEKRSLVALLPLVFEPMRDNVPRLQRQVFPSCHRVPVSGLAAAVVREGVLRRSVEEPLPVLALARVEALRRDEGAEVAQLAARHVDTNLVVDGSARGGVAVDVRRVHERNRRRAAVAVVVSVAVARPPGVAHSLCAESSPSRDRVPAVPLRIPEQARAQCAVKDTVAAGLRADDRRAQDYGERVNELHRPCEADERLPQRKVVRCEAAQTPG
jgi:hypothetical protein